MWHVRDDLVMARLFPIPTKFWAHRCNDPRKIEEAMALYSGVELDIIFYPAPDGGIFEVSHDLQSKVAHPLDDFFAILSLGNRGGN